MIISSEEKVEKLLKIILNKVKTKYHSSTQIIRMIKKVFLSCKDDYYNNKIDSVLKEIIQYDHQGFLKFLYGIIEHSSYSDKLQFFKGILYREKISDITLGEWERSFWDEFKFESCIFKNVIIDAPMSLLTSENPFLSIKYGSFNNVEFSQLNYGSWRDIKESRIPWTNFTFRTNLYLELERACNANCSFCRNNSFPNTPYNYDEIVKSLRFIRKYIDNIIIGGGEPTLLMPDLIKLKKLISEINPYTRSYVFTNGSAPLTDYQMLMSYWGSNFFRTVNPFGIYVSRHAIDGERNAEIFNYSSPKDMSKEKLMEIAKSPRNVLSATCVKNGLDSPKRILEYIHWGINILDFSNILISNLHDDFSMGSSCNSSEEKVDSNIFSRVFFELESMGFEKK
jgi:hypothetical protein